MADAFVYILQLWFNQPVQQCFGIICFTGKHLVSDGSFLWKIFRCIGSNTLNAYTLEEIEYEEGN